MSLTETNSDSLVERIYLSLVGQFVFDKRENKQDLDKLDIATTLYFLRLIGNNFLSRKQIDEVPSIQVIF